MSHHPDSGESYKAVLNGLLRMHGLSADGLFESDEADALRDAMDGPWQALSPVERKRAAGLSADLNALEGPCEPLSPCDEGGLAEARLARERGEYDRALELLREGEKGSLSAATCYLRGMIWSAAGHPDVAVVFFGHAARLDPANEEYRAALHGPLLSA